VDGGYSWDGEFLGGGGRRIRMKIKIKEED
jgi:hypothetical protein